MSQWYCVVSGTRYGPVDAQQVQTWVAQGRVGPDDLVWREGMGEWQAISAVPELSGPGAPAAGLPVSGPTAAAQTQRAGWRVVPHRGGAVLALGIVGLVVCFICGIIAWVMGSSDLKAMAAGQMDPTGKGITQAGKICGMISVILAIVGFGFWILWFAFFFSMGVH